MGTYDGVLGPLVLGVFLNTYTYGVVGFQYANYQEIPFKDPLWIRLPVLVMFLLDTFQSASAVYMAWNLCVTNYDNPAVMQAALWTYSLIPICAGISGVITHIFLSHRIFVLTGRNVTYGIVGALSFITFGLAVSAGGLGLAERISATSILSGSDLYRTLLVAWLSVQTFTDLFVAGSLAYTLSHIPAFMSHLPSPFERILRGVLQTGSAAFLVSLLGLVVFVASPTTNAYLVFILALGRLYSNSILDTLLARPKPVAVSNLQVSAHVKSKSSTRGIWVPTSSNPAQTTNSFSLNSIHIRTEVFSDREDVPKKAEALGSRSGSILEGSDDHKNGVTDGIAVAV